MNQSLVHELDNESPSWKQQVDKRLIAIENELKTYLKSEHMEFEWYHWECHEGGVTSRFRREIWSILGYDDEHDGLPIKTKQTEILLNVLDHALCAQLNLLYEVVKNEPKRKQMKMLKQISDKVVDKTMDRLEKESYPSLYNDVIEEYKEYWHAAEKIQIHWRNAISNPNYSLCQRRLKNESKALTL